MRHQSSPIRNEYGIVFFAKAPWLNDFHFLKPQKQDQLYISNELLLSLFHHTDVLDIRAQNKNADNSKLVLRWITRHMEVEAFFYQWPRILLICNLN